MVDPMVGAEVNKRILHALAGALTDDIDYAFSGIDVRQGWGGIVSVTIYGETDEGVPGAPGRALLQAVEAAMGTERHIVKLETARRS
ncbi:MAG TPA: hypothetical protein VG346_06460 [Acidimicrobiales bacterium]|jgi:hypothetical protein|nr:hypothetical protein [Acidimicrobiales bacterium]